MSIQINFPFDTPSNYTYNLNLIDIATGKGLLKDLRPASATFYNAFNTKDADWCNGNKIGTLHGGAVVLGGQLDLTGYVASKYIEFSAINNADSSQTGCIRFRITPNYSGSPIFEQHILEITKYNRESQIYIYHKLNNHIQWYIRDKDSNYIAGELKVWSPVAGQEYEFEINYDITNGESRLFIDGIQLGTTQIGTGIRENALILQCGRSFTNPHRPNFYMNDLLIFSTPQHIANYTPDWSNISETIYSKNNPVIEINTTLKAKTISDFLTLDTITGSNNIKYILKKNDIWYWYNSEWVVSNGTYAESNIESEILTNLSTFITETTNIKIKIFLHSDDGMTTPEIDELTIDYDFEGEPADPINKCLVWLYSKFTNGSIDKREIKINLEKSVAQYKNNTAIRRAYYTLYPDSFGYVEIELVETVNMSGTEYYIFNIGEAKYRTSIPNELTKNFWDLPNLKRIN